GDQQAKLRGHRIELLALEAALNGHPGLSETAAMVISGDGARGKLVVYAVARGEPLPLASLREFVASRLPPIYQPDRIEWLSGMPRTANGKCDRAALRLRAAQGAAWT